MVAIKWNMCFLYFLLFTIITHGIACKVSEFACKDTNNICVPLDKYCDGKNDCVDGSDEPKHCTVCNRTYYGDIGRTYSITVPTPQWNKLPFLCHLTFTASGHDQGDIVQDHAEQHPGISSIDLENSATPFQKPKKKKTDENTEKVQLLKRVVYTLENEKEEKDEASVFGLAWEVSYRKLSGLQQFFPMKAIEEIFILGQSIPMTISPPTQSPVFVAVPNFVRSTPVVDFPQSNYDSYVTEHYENFQDLFNAATYGSDDNF